ncbi:MAG TPA: class I SAM-dependent methyltransferase [Methanobacteriaceae archaeon]|nr:class I SAM-dependent methyltransferase [Methanobacteriaceae archaeon]
MARVELNRKFKTNPYSWLLWIFDHIHFPKGARVLEIGCGNALLWKSNLSRVPADAHILLSDFSEGMLNDARNVLGDAMDKFEYEVIDAQQIPYPDSSFDIVIANLMLYHIPDRKNAIYEISRVLKIDGAFYATTFGIDNMKELNDLVANYDSKIYYSLEPFARAFGLENGEEQLSEYFKEIKIIKYLDSLEITEPGPLVDYLFSFGNVKEAITGQRIEEFWNYIANILEKEEKIEITKDTGIFIAKKPK